MTAVKTGYIDILGKTTKDDVSVDLRVDGGFMHKFSVPWGISKEQAIDLQLKLGYHPAGYGFYSFKTSCKETTWKCGSSCD